MSIIRKLHIYCKSMWCIEKSIDFYQSMITSNGIIKYLGNIYVVLPWKLEIHLDTSIFFHYNVSLFIYDCVCFHRRP